jgi:hypothetical protein
MNRPWRFEPCDPEGERTPLGDVWPHAVRGVKPGGRRVMGYGYSEGAAQESAEEAARYADARETIGERGEIRPVGDAWVRLREAFRQRWGG